MPQIRCSTQESGTLAGRRFILHRSSEFGAVLGEMKDRIPEEIVTGPPV